ncbi:hypothetical protein F2P81_005804 [Scophthalmus maximus]|uniref:Uncharacterized protein n=1 Tax=Scophthalmus maximus TaxID=52904 RepID=A0A6A4TJL7_SCOMX|nr:hypothetical protein F2P81_005804 [Scophthalmus maximus]
MLDTMADRPCDTKFRCDADDWRACGEFIKSLWWEWGTPCRFPMFSIAKNTEFVQESDRFSVTIDCVDDL